MKPQKKFIRSKFTLWALPKNKLKKPYLLDEFKRHPWLYVTYASWDEATNKLFIHVGYEFEERLAEGAFDEISDCVIATMHVNKEIEFDIQRI